jgi:archaeal type IV pilus assembly protein PilA
MKTLRKIRKNAKALSPVVASIILIAVTVAVSIAVAAWMGALTVGFMGSSSLTITDATFTEGVDATTGSIVIDVKNTGTKDVTIAAVKVNDNPQTNFSAAVDETLPSGGTEVVTINMAVTLGNPYKIDLYDGSGQVVGSYQATAN